MKLIQVCLAIGISAFQIPAQAADHTIKMLNTGTDGIMVFEPGYLHVKKGDTVTFVPTDPAHNSSLVAGPEGGSVWTGSMNEEIKVTFDTPGVYLYQCDPHKIMAMVGVIQVDEATNKAEIQTAAKNLKANMSLNQDRLD